jgi:hypothetical protein
MVGNRPVVGVRNPVGSFFPPSFLRAKNAHTGLSGSDTARGGQPHPGNQNPGFKKQKPGFKKQKRRVSPVRLLEAAPQS